MAVTTGGTGLRGLAAAAVAALLAPAACAGARRAERHAPPSGAELRVFAVPGHGAIELPIPKGWTAEAGSGEPASPTIRLERPGGGFVALLTPFWNPGEPESGPERVDTARLFAELARRNAIAGAAELDVPLHALGGEGVHGFWFAATDRTLEGREPGPEEWRHVLQGAAAVGPLVLAFTLLDNADGPQREAVLDMVRSARHVEAKGEAREPRTGVELELDPDARTVPLRVEVAGKAWAVLVDLPGFRMFKSRRSDDGKGVLVLGEDPQSGIVASVILKPAGAARDAGACRDLDLPRIREAASDLTELDVATAGVAARASYSLSAPGDGAARQRHGHAWLEREGVCANVHVSKVDPDPDDAAAMERILSSARFGEEL
jgi:hypothetical protein